MHNLLKGVSDPFYPALTIFTLDKTTDETFYAHHFLDILHTAMMKIIELPFHLRLGKA